MLNSYQQVEFFHHRVSNQFISIVIPSFFIFYSITFPRLIIRSGSKRERSRNSSAKNNSSSSLTEFTLLISLRIWVCDTTRAQNKVFQPRPGPGWPEGLHCYIVLWKILIYCKGRLKNLCCYPGRITMNIGVFITEWWLL